MATVQALRPATPLDAHLDTLRKRTGLAAAEDIITHLADAGDEAALGRLADVAAASWTGRG